jgi:hypothetical protein
MNSDLYLDETDSSRALSSTKRLASSTSAYLLSTSLFFSASNAACESDCSSSRSVTDAASTVLSTRPMLSVSCSSSDWCAGLKASKDASSITARTDPSNRIGSTMMFSGVAAPRPELICT